MYSNAEANASVSELEYNSERETLIIPEYGRHLQKLIALAVDIEDREERNKAAKHIISVMGVLNPHLRDVAEFQHKLWDQIYIMSDFKLDFDSPFPLPTKELLEQRPEKLPYPQKRPKYRFYGNMVLNMIDQCKTIDNEKERDALITLTANQMKKGFLEFNKDNVEDDVIFEHFEELAKGDLKIDREKIILAKTGNLLKTIENDSNKGKVGKGNNVNNNNNNFGNNKKKLPFKGPAKRK
jgi:hypothetical protein